MDYAYLAIEEASKRSGWSGTELWRYESRDSEKAGGRGQVIEDRRGYSHARDGLDEVLMLVELEVAMQVGTRSRRVG